jgi:AraC-like DNA-binding protein
MNTISPVYARLVLREFERREIDPAPLFSGIALSRDELVRGGDISMDAFLHILRTGHRLMADEQLGLMLGRSMHVFAMGPLGSGMAMAPSLREGLQLLESFTRLHASYIEISVRSTLRGLTATIHYQHDTGELEGLHSETAMMLLQQYAETLAAEPVTDIEYRLAIPKPENPASYARAFHGPISFGANVNEVDIPTHCLDLPSPFYHPELWRQAQMNLAQSLKAQSEKEGIPYTQHIMALLQSSEPPLPELGDVAFDLHVSERTLNRRLRTERTSYRQLKSRAMADRAKLCLLQTNHSVEAIAAELGYRDVANFRRAFRKTEGCSPSQYRQRVSAADK